MITIEGLNEANSKIKGVDLKGKKYALVAERVQIFRQLCPDGLITTEILFMEAGAVTMKASIYDETGKLLATGLAQEKEGGSFINKTSYIENCETSAVGRALAMLGIGSECSMASAEEVVNAQMQQKEQRRKEQQPQQQEAAEAPVAPVAEFNPNALCTETELETIKNIWSKKTELSITSCKRFENWPNVTKEAYVWFMRKTNGDESKDNTANASVPQ